MQVSILFVIITFYTTKKEKFTYYARNILFSLLCFNQALSWPRLHSYHIWLSMARKTLFLSSRFDFYLVTSYNTGTIFLQKS